MNVIFDKNNKKRDEKVILLLVLGVLEALSQKKITLDEAEGVIFTPYTEQYLAKYGFSDDLRSIVIDDGCMFEDYASLLPDRYEQNILDTKEKVLKLLGEYEAFERGFWVTFDGDDTSGVK